MKEEAKITRLPAVSIGQVTFNKEVSSGPVLKRVLIAVEKDIASDSLFEDEDSRDFYERLPNISLMVPEALLKQQEATKTVDAIESPEATDKESVDAIAAE